MLATCYCRVTVELLSYLKIRQFMRVARQHGPNLEQVSELAKQACQITVVK
jgi:hypothetical protein